MMRDLLKSHFNAFGLLVFCLILHSCVNTITGNEDKDEEASDDFISGTIPINIVAESLHKQIYNKNFESYIGLYAYYSSSSLDKDPYIDNQKLICNEKGFSSINDIFYPIDKSKINIMTYHPYSDVGFKKGCSIMDVKTEVDQSSSIHYNLSDFMLAKNMETITSNNDIKMFHEHQFSQLSIVIRLIDDTDIESLRNKNPRIIVNDVFTQASFNINTKDFLDYRQNSSIIPNGIWSIDGNKLIGKKCIIIPQLLSSTKNLISLNIDDKSYSIKLSDNYQLIGGSSNEITILYSSDKGVVNLVTQINEWEEGMNIEVVPSENDGKQKLSIADFDFSKTNVYEILSQGEIIAEVCKEYLYNEDIKNTAIVIYPLKENNTNYQKGVVWQIYDDKGKVGGIVNWNKIHNRFEYNEGDLAELPFIYFDRNGELQLLEPMSSLTIYIQGKYLNDIRGTENIIYPTVKIGTQYWMREDLRTAKYTDGSAISKKTESTYSKVAAGYFLMNNYYFYNKKAVISEKISPDGWRIADYQDWDMLKYYLNGESSVLKAIDKWDESQYSTTNLTGFNALPAGLFNKISNADESGYAFYNQYVAYWSMGISQNTLSEKAILLNYNSNEIKNASYTDYSGYCIRCVEN